MNVMRPSVLRLGWLEPALVATRLGLDDRLNCVTSRGSRGTRVASRRAAGSGQPSRDYGVPPDVAPRAHSGTSGSRRARSPASANTTGAGFDDTVTCGSRAAANASTAQAAAAAA